MLAGKLITLCILLCLELVTADVRTVFMRNETWQGKTYTASLNIRNSLLSIITCIRLEHDDQKCNVSLTTMDGQSKEALCDLRFDYNYTYYFLTYPMTEDKVILVSYTQGDYEEKSNRTYGNYSVISFPDCTTADAKISFENRWNLRESLEINNNQLIINEDNTFDVFYSDSKICGDEICKITFDAEAKKVRGPITFPQRHAYFNLKYVPSTLNFIVDELETFLVKPDGRVSLKKYKADGDYKSNLYDRSVSHGLIHVCSVVNDNNGARQEHHMTIYCKQFDYNGDLRSEINVALPTHFPSHTKILATENLANGEFLLRIRYDENDFVIKVKSDGSIYGIRQLFPFVLRPYGTEKSNLVVDNNQYCVTRANYDKYASNDNKYLNILRECFTDDDLH